MVHLSVFIGFIKVALFINLDSYSKVLISCYGYMCICKLYVLYNITDFVVIIDMYKRTKCFPRLPERS